MTKQNNRLKAYHHFKLKLKQLICIHGDYVYLEVTTQKKPANGKHISFAVGCKNCGWINTSGSVFGMPRTLRNSYDTTYLKITDKNDVLLSDLKQRKEKRELYEKYDRENGTDWVSTL